MSLSTVLVPATVVVVLTIVLLVVMRERNRRQADRRAEQLVRDLLTPAELAHLKAVGHLDVPSGTWPGRVYRVPAEPGLVTVIDDEIPVVRLCLLPVRSVPEAEYVIIHKLLIEGAEAEYWKHANRFPGGLSGGSCAVPTSVAGVEVWTGQAPGVIGQR
jgi:hypothetical protein